MSPVALGLLLITTREKDCQYVTVQLKTEIPAF